jgi:hypothetical protein
MGGSSDCTTRRFQKASLTSSYLQGRAAARVSGYDYPERVVRSGGGFGGGSGGARAQGALRDGLILADEDLVLEEEVDGPDDGAQELVLVGPVEGVGRLRERAGRVVRRQLGLPRLVRALGGGVVRVREQQRVGRAVKEEAEALGQVAQVGRLAPH